MADSPERPGLLTRLARAFREPNESSASTVVKAEPSPVQSGPVPSGTKASLLPRYLAMRQVGSYAYADFIPLDNRGHVLDVLGDTGIAFVAYWYVAARWRAQKIAEAPLMVVEEDQKTGTEEWLADHELAEVLDEPSPDYDMGELLERTSRYLDNHGACLWVFDENKMGVVGRITPFRPGEFEIVPREGRLYGAFKVTTAKGPKEYEAEEVAYFRDSMTDSWSADGKSRLDVAMSWLRLGEHARQTIRDLLDNAVWPSLVVTTDPSWNPDEAQLEMLKAELDQYAAPGNKGKAFAALGGGSADVLAAKIRDLVPEEVLNRVESVIAAVSGVPAIVLQFQVGMENSPWSQMGEARNMAYDDAIQPAWRRIERVLTRQMLRPVDEDKTHFIRFDRSKVASLQADQLEAATIATMWGRAASLNERREKMGLEPLTDAKADEVPELTQPDPLTLIGGGADDDEEGGEEEEAPAEAEKRRMRFELWLKSTSLNERRFFLGLPLINSPKADEVDALLEGKAAAPLALPAGPGAELERKGPAPAKIRGRVTEDEEKARRRQRRRRQKVGALQLAIRGEGVGGMELMADRLLAADANEIALIVKASLAEPAREDQKYLQKADRGKARTISAILGYVKNTSQPAWRKGMGPLVAQAAERGTAVIAADIGINFNLLSPHVAKYAREETAFLVKGISETTLEAIQKVLGDGIDAGKSVLEIARDVADSGSFTRSRARLIARTESTRANSGGPTKALEEHAKATKRRYTKTWSTAGDDRVRDEHEAMEGETVGISEKFSNGREFPDEPNCRCALIYNEEVDE